MILNTFNVQREINHELDCFDKDKISIIDYTINSVDIQLSPRIDYQLLAETIAEKFPQGFFTWEMDFKTSILTIEWT